MTKLIAHTIDLFKAVVATPTKDLQLACARHGFVTNFVPTPEQREVLKDTFKGLPIITLFSVDERMNAPLESLILKQWLHYIEVYGMGAPGLFGLEVEGGKVETIAYIRAITVAELEALVHGLLYSNRPVKDTEPILELIHGYNLSYDINKVLNNELKVALFDVKRDKFKSGDDAVRYICYAATTQTMLIKSKAVVEQVKSHKPLTDFLYNHMVPLAKVFNRHKRIIMACKNPLTRNIINRISHLSKRLHTPLPEQVSKSLVASYVKGTASPNLIEGVSIRDKFKFLNLIEWKLQGREYDTFLVRNGKVWFEKDRKVLDPTPLKGFRAEILLSLIEDFRGLQGLNILLDPFVDYGLPISRKQTLGNLPFGTKVSAPTQADRLSAGIYWHNSFWDGKSIDLDLSAIDQSGNRTGWGGYAGYTGKGIIFSGDLVDARNGAMEFMTVNPTHRNSYGLMVNTFRGPEPCECEIVVGTSTKKDWLDETIIRERTSLKTKDSIIGFIKDDSFVVHGGSLSNSRISGGKHPIIDKGLGKLWTVRYLLMGCGIKFDTTAQPDVVYDHDLTYSKFSLDKLEALLGV